MIASPNENNPVTFSNVINVPVSYRTVPVAPEVPPVTSSPTAKATEVEYAKVLAAYSDFKSHKLPDVPPVLNSPNTFFPSTYTVFVYVSHNVLISSFHPSIDSACAVVEPLVGIIETTITNISFAKASSNISS